MRGSIKRMVPVCLALANASIAADLYPDVRTIILEAQKIAAGMPVVPNKPRPFPSAGDLLARAGYIDDAAQAYRIDGGYHMLLVRAKTLYGDADGARQMALEAATPERKSSSLENIADMLWRMGFPDKARVLLAEARSSLKSIIDPSRRKTQQIYIDQLSTVLANPPPDMLSAEPRPRKKAITTSSIPPFPVTTDGFRTRDTAAITNDAKQNAEFLTQLFALAVAGNRKGLLDLTKSAKTPFQTMLAWATLEHVFIQLSQPQTAEEFARLIQEDGSDCSLAKSEALAAAGAAWGRNKQEAQAERCFNDALHLASRVGKELAFGRAIVVVKVADAQASAGLPGSVPATLDLALDLAHLVPPRPKPVNGIYPKGYFENHQAQDDVYLVIFETATRLQEVAEARKTADRWHEASGSSANFSMLTDWIDAGHNDEALLYTRSLPDRDERMKALLDVARDLLDHAGAPVF